MGCSFQVPLLICLYHWRRGRVNGLCSNTATASIKRQYMRKSNLFIIIFFALVLLCSCSVEDLPLDPTDPTTDQPALDTRIHLEPDQTWASNFSARDISWRLLSFTQLRNSISAVGSFQITFVNANFDRDWQTDVAIRFRGADGALHIPSIPLNSIFVAADSTIAIRDNFILEVKDPQTANAITQMSITLF